MIQKVTNKIFIITSLKYFVIEKSIRCLKYKTLNNKVIRFNITFKSITETGEKSKDNKKKAIGTFININMDINI